MQATLSRNRATQVEPSHLRFDVFDAICAAERAHSYSERAALFDLDKKTMWRLCNHEVQASIGMAQHICRRLNIATDALFGPDAKSARDLAKAKAA